MIDEVQRTPDEVTPERFEQSELLRSDRALPLTKRVLTMRLVLDLSEGLRDSHEAGELTFIFLRTNDPDTLRHAVHLSSEIMRNDFPQISHCIIGKGLASRKLRRKTRSQNLQLLGAHH